MTLNRFRCFTLGTAAVFCSAAAFAQTPDSAAPAPKSPDKMFLHKASMGGYAEVQLGQLAAQKGNSEDVKKFGQKMVDDHTALNEQMKPFVESAGLKPPMHLDKKDQAEYDKLNGLSGADFDREYVSDMVADHHKDLREFRQESAAAADPQLKETVTSGEKVIAEHNRMADHLAQQIGVPVPGRPNPTVQPPAR